MKIFIVVEYAARMRNKRTCDYIAEAIQNEILSGRMEAGQPLRQEELAETLGYSRIPIREALQILEERGLVRRLATRHVVVADFSDKVVEEIFEMICEVEKKALRDLAQAKISWNFSGEQEGAEEAFHEFVYERIQNEFFRRMLVTAAECFVRFAVNETEAGTGIEQTALRIQKIMEVYQSYQVMDYDRMNNALDQYYGWLIGNVKEERRMAE